MDDRFWASVLSEDALRDGEMTSIQHGQRRIGLYNLDGQYYATDDIGSEAFAYLTDGTLENGVVVGPSRDQRFDVRSGRSLVTSTLGDLQTYPVRVDRGNVEVLLYPHDFEIVDTALLSGGAEN